MRDLCRAREAVMGDEKRVKHRLSKFLLRRGVRWTPKLDAFAREVPWAEPVGWLRCFRGIDTLTALTVVTELHGWRRFDTPRALMAYLGLAPSEHSSGGKERRGARSRERAMGVCDAS